MRSALSFTILDPTLSVSVSAAEDDKLVLSDTFPYQGETIHFSIAWTRAATP